MFEESTLYIVGNAKTQQNNPITIQYGQFFIAFVVHQETGVIIECDVTTTVKLTADFIRSLFIGKSLQDDAEMIRAAIESRYFASSQKAILVAYKDAQKKYINIKKGIKVDFL